MSDQARGRGASFVGIGSWNSLTRVVTRGQGTRIFGAYEHPAVRIQTVWTSPVYRTATSEVHAFNTRCGRELRVSSWQERKASTPQPLPSPHLLSPSSSLVNAMTVDFNRLWKKARTATDEAESIRTLAEILTSKDGRAFILDLEVKDAELCIEILDHVNSNPPSAALDCHSPME